jgi:hypothetical protein
MYPTSSITRSGIRPRRVKLFLEAALGVGLGEAGDPLGRGGERDAVTGLAGPDADPDGEVGLAGARRAEEHDVGALGDEVEGPEMQDGVAFEGALVVVVEVLEGLAGREPGSADAAFAAVVLAGGDLAFETGSEELLMGPPVTAGSFGEPVDRRRQRRCLQRPAEERQIRRRLPGGGAAGGHHATPRTRS